jgi:hypothetical protein
MKKDSLDMQLLYQDIQNATTKPILNEISCLLNELNKDEEYNSHTIMILKNLKRQIRNLSK